MRSRSTVSVISLANSFAAVIASGATPAARATSGSRRMSSLVRAGGAAGAAGGFGGVVVSAIVSSCAFVLPAFFLHQLLQLIERFGFAGDAERDVFRFAGRDRVRVAFAIPAACTAVGLRHRREQLRLPLPA